MSQNPKVKLLLVDDQPANLLVLQEILDSPEYELVPAASGAEALRCILRDDFAAVVLDLQMPGISGLETAKLIKERERCKSVPILFLTAFGQSELTMMAGYLSGAVDFLTKPIEPLILRSKVAVFVELYRQQDKLRQLNQALAASESELRLTNRSLEETVNLLREANSSLDAFAHSISHDLRAPLRHIEAFAGMLADTVGPKLDERETHFLNVVQESARRMSHMTEDLLSFARVSRSEMHFHNVDMDRMVSDVIHELRSGIKGREVEFKLQSMPKVSGDASMLRLVWMNLIGNAIKYTGKVEHAVIEIGSTERRDEHGRRTFFVRDNGAGFDMAYADKLFGVFQRLHTQAEFEGTGAGLSIVKRIVDRHGGEIRAEAKVGEGAAFYFSLLESTPSAAEKPAEPTTAPSERIALAT